MTTLKTADRLTKVAPSITMAVTAKAAELRAQGIDVVSFGAGEPDFDTPEHIKQAAVQALAAGQTKYTHVMGTPALRKAIAAELGQAHGLSFSPDQIIVSCGAKHSLYNLFQALLSEGEEVIVPAPYWVSYPAMVRLAGGEAVVVKASADSGFLLEPSDLKKAITPRTRALILNTPSNPTGAVYDEARLRAIGELAVEHDFVVVSDDIYRKLVYAPAKYVSIAALGADIADHTIIVDGVSKSYAMTGWRIGYTAGPKNLIKGMSKVQSQSTSGPASVSQAAALAAITGPQECVSEMRTQFDSRRKKMVELLRAIDGVTCSEPLGAFYAFPDLSAFVGRRTEAGTTIEDDVALATYLVEVGRVALVPGSGFGMPGFARLSYACSMEQIEDGVGRLAEALGKLQS